MADIHPTAVIAPGAELADDVSVGPYAVIGGQVQIGAGSRIGPHCVIEGRTQLGRNNRVFQFASIGAAPQDKKYAGEATRLLIGDDNTVREFVTINTGTVQGGGLTQIGSDNWIMAYVHIAHDCRVADHTIIANATQLGGHVTLGDWVFLGGLSGMHQFVRVGAHAMTGFQTRLSQDLPPFVTAAGNPASATGINQEGLQRRGFSGARVAAVKRMHKLIYRQGLTLAASTEALRALGDESPESAETPELSAAAADIQLMLDFLAHADRGIVR